MSTFFLPIFARLFIIQFVCVDCQWNVLTKYVYGDTVIPSFDYAQSRCNQWYGTSLASIHNDGDNEAVKALCTSAAASNCFIGLHDRNTPLVFEWLDGTTWDYGTNVIGGIYPWAISNNGNSKQPDNWGGEDCVSLISEGGYNWNDGDCGWNIPFICNAQSVLCLASTWNTTDNHWVFDPSNTNCDVINNNDGMSTDLITLNISSDAWKPIAMEYMYKINGINNDYNGLTGIVIDIIGYDIMSTIYRFYVGIVVENDGSIIDLFIRYENTATYIVRRNIKSVIILNGNIYYEIRIELNENSVFDISLNDVSYIQQDISNILPLNYYINTLGMQNINQSTTSKSLFINGTVTSQYFVTDIPTAEPTDNPTNHPTIYPTTASPTNQPITHSPTTDQPTTDQPTTSNPTTSNPTSYPTTSHPITSKPTIIPTIIPTIAPSFRSTTAKTTLNATVNEEDDSFGLEPLDVLILFIIIAILLCIICLFVLYFFCYKKKLKEQTATVVFMDTNKDDKNHKNALVINAKPKMENAMINDNEVIDFKMYPVIPSPVQQTNIKMGENSNVINNALEEGDNGSDSSQSLYNTNNVTHNATNDDIDDDNDDNDDNDDLYQNDEINVTSNDLITLTDNNITNGAPV